MSARSLIDVLLPWLAPPLVGAVIGYVTNAIAIRMLFRPLGPVRLFGIRLPLTPGVIPRERGRLARSIGEMVSRELITAEALQRQIHEPRTLAALSASVSEATAGLLARPLGELREGVAALVPASLEAALQALLARATSSPAFLAAVRDLVSRAVSSVAARRLDVEGSEVERFVVERVLPLAAAPDSRQAIGDALGELLATGDAVSDELLDHAVDLLAPAVPAAAERLLDWVRSPPVLEVIEREGRRILAAAIERLTALQRFLVSAGQFDRRLDERMPEIVAEAVAAIERTVRDPDRQAGVLAALRKAAGDWRDGVRADAGRAQAASRTAAGFVDGLLAGLADPDRRASLARLLRGRLGRGGATLGGLARRTLGIGENDATEFLSSRLLGWLAQEQTAGMISRELSALASRFLEERAGAPLGEVLGIDARRKASLDEWLTARLVRLVDERLPAMLQGVDIEALVVRKIDGLDVRDVERLLLRVIASHLRWINVFGALLGGLIGIAQALLTRLMPR